MEKAANLNNEKQDHQMSSQDMNGGVPNITEVNKNAQVFHL